ncbi:MAG: hypothetical protein HRT56_07085 [Coraliomargarita sp.]|nr:hypothetical protein [Coraliomargarita sp.]
MTYRVFESEDFVIGVFLGWIKRCFGILNDAVELDRFENGMTVVVVIARDGCPSRPSFRVWWTLEGKRPDPWLRENGICQWQIILPSPRNGFKAWGFGSLD